ncbi:MAG TPA: branched-chain amino acid ABC transporter permease [Erysipelothrix sp.]|jgi:branched-chain amino acid transport system permease protein|nr:branched-chain amino acid ABC transporter permease [Erysipelothrix sp.]
MKNKLNNPILGYILIGAIFASLVFFVNIGVAKTSYLITFGVTMIYAIVALGLNLLLGYSGLISLGTAGFMGFAAYISGYIFNNTQLPFEIGALIAIIIPTLLGILVGLISLKIQGIYLAIATLAISEIFREVFIQLDWFTRGSAGMVIGDYPTLLGIFQLDQKGTYLLIVAVMVVVFILVHFLTKGYLGRSLNTMRSSEPAARAMGVNVFYQKVLSFTIATAISALGGVLYVHFVRYSAPGTWTLNLSLTFLAIIVVGGFRSISGTLIGALLLYSFTEIFFKNPALPFLANLTPIIRGGLMILFVIFWPNGIASFFSNIKNKYLAKRSLKEGDA